jgi:DNA (cytosine-5)-methyltransferase 1
MPIPIIDIFAGPGGLGEGFSNLLDNDNKRIFKIKLSIEKDAYAHQTLKLRSFFRQFDPGKVPADYYSFIKGQLSLKELYSRHPEEAGLADREAWCGTLGKPDEKDTNGVSNKEVDKRIEEALENNPDWLLIGGPPCQAYSLVGRARRQETILDEAKDKRVGLYKEYLRIIAVHNPAVFVMENVKGILSAQTENEYVFRRILDDLSDPLSAYISEGDEIIKPARHTRYRIYSLTTMVPEYDIYNNPVFNPKDFVIKSEQYGIPQKRHRVILLGIREDLQAPDEVLTRSGEVSLASVIGNLPRIRSGATRSYNNTTMGVDKGGKPKKRRHYDKVSDSAENWSDYVKGFGREIDDFIEPDPDEKSDLPVSLGKEYQPLKKSDLEPEHPLRRWYEDVQLGGVLQHVSRKHLVQDLKRYLFAARYTRKHGSFPRLDDYKNAGNGLLPDHENAGSGKFTDRFRVQMPDIPATTVTSHISKDGHYFIHYDPSQCRSFTVREAARVQTFPDNYYFCGERTQQFHQVGNAVPPYLAYQIARIVVNIFNN